MCQYTIVHTGSETTNIDTDDGRTISFIIRETESLNYQVVENFRYKWKNKSGSVFW